MSKHEQPITWEIRLQCTHEESGRHHSAVFDVPAFFDPSRIGQTIALGLYAQAGLSASMMDFSAAVDLAEAAGAPDELVGMMRARIAGYRRMDAGLMAEMCEVLDPDDLNQLPTRVVVTRAAEGIRNTPEEFCLSAETMNEWEAEYHAIRAAQREERG